jgi:hypothetical protein
MGDYTQLNPAIPPSPLELVGLLENPNHTDQAPLFESVVVRTSCTRVIANWFHLEPRLNLVPPAEDTPKDLVREFQMWRVFPVHPKWALLFMCGVKPKLAFHFFHQFMVNEMLQAYHQAAPLRHFLHGAVTADAQGISAIQSGWRRKDPGKIAGVKAWHYELLAHHACLPAMGPRSPKVRKPRRCSGGVSRDSVDQFVDLLTERFGQPAQWDERKSEVGDKYNK